MSQKIYESYKWVVPFETGTTQGKKVIIRGKALHATLSSNLRKYVKEELERSARSLAQKYIDVNHEYSVWAANKARYDKGESAVSPGPKPSLKGNVIDAEFEDGFIEYIGEVNSREYVDKLADREKMTEAEYVKKYGKRPIRCVSVDATYRFHREKDGSLEPHGIIFNGLSLVEDPESPGVEGTTVEVMEIRETLQMEPQFKILQNLLGEMNIISEVVERDGNKILEGKMLENVNVGEVKSPVETDEERVKKNMGISEEDWLKLDSKVRLSHLQKLPRQVAKPAIVKTLDLEPAKAKPAEVVKPLEEIKVGHLELKFPEPIEVELPEPWDKYRLSKEDYVKKYGAEKWEREVQHLGEPFADYTSFEDCVAKNADKDDPEAYCATIKRQTEGETLEGKIGEVKREHQRKIMAKSIAHLAKRQESFEKTVAEILGKMDKRDLGIVEACNKLIESIPSIDSVKKLYELVEGKDKDITAGFKSVSETFTGLETQIGELKTIMDSFKAEMGNNLTSLKADMDKTFEGKLATYKNTELEGKITALDSKITAINTGEAQMAEIREMFKNYQEDRGKTLTETKDQTKTLRETVDQLKAKIENLEEKVKRPEFKTGASNGESPLPSASNPKPAGRLNPTSG